MSSYETASLRLQGVFYGKGFLMEGVDEAASCRADFSSSRPKNSVLCTFSPDDAAGCQ